MTPNEVKRRLTKVTEAVSRDSIVTMEIRNLRDSIGGLNNSVQENSDFTEQLVNSNEQLISEMNDRDDR